jgi:Peptidase C13 family
MEMPAGGMRIEYTVTREDYAAGLAQATQAMLRAVRWGAAMYFITAASVICGIVIGMGYIELVNGYIGRNWRLQWLIAVAFLAVCLLTIWQSRLRAARVYAACSPDDNPWLGAQTLTLAPDGLTHEARDAAQRVVWPAVKQIICDDAKSDGAILIVLNHWSFVAIPAAAFANAEERAAWIAALRTHAVSAVVYTPAAATVTAAQGMEAGGAAAAAPTQLGLYENLRAGARLAFFRPAPLERFVATPEAFALLVLLELGLLLMFGVASVGLPGQFNVHALPRALLFVPLILLLGVLAVHATQHRARLLALPVALLASGLVVSFIAAIAGIALQQKFIAVAARHWQWLFYFQIAWWSAIIVIAAWRLAPERRHRGAGVGVLGVALLAAPPAWLPQDQLWMPPYDNEARRVEMEKHQALADEQGFYAQHDALQRALEKLQPERAGVADVYALTVGLYAAEDVFMREVRLIDKLMRERFDAEGRSLMLLNNPKTVRELPVASATSLSAALKHIGGLMNREEDVLALYVSSHGSERHDLSVNFWPLRLKPVNPLVLKKALDDSGIRWKILVVSACYSGGFVEPLKDEHTLIITASSATKTSFGCGNESEATYLAKALYDEALRKTLSFEQAFETARGAIRQREQAQKYEPSDPQIFVGEAMRGKLKQVEERLLRGKPSP